MTTESNYNLIKMPSRKYSKKNMAPSDTESINTEDFESESESESGRNGAYGKHVRIVDKDDIALRTSSIEGAGKGVFCKRGIPARTILPFYALIKKLSHVKDGTDHSYFMSVSYMNSNNEARCIQTLIADGNPTLSCTKKLPRSLRAASYVNESTKAAPNCVFVKNPCISKQDVINSHREKKPIPVTLLVVPRDLQEGEELLTMYGPDYKRTYNVWIDKKGYKDKIVDLAHEIVDENKCQIAQYLK